MNTHTIVAFIALNSALTISSLIRSGAFDGTIKDRVWLLVALLNAFAVGINAVNLANRLL